MNTPVVLTTKTLIVFLLGVVILSAGVAVAAARLSQPASADAASGNAAVVKQLKSLNRKIGTSEFDTGSVWGTLHTIRRGTDYGCQMLVELNNNFARSSCH